MARGDLADHPASLVLDTEVSREGPDIRTGHLIADARRGIFGGARVQVHQSNARSGLAE